MKNLKCRNKNCSNRRNKEILKQNKRNLFMLLITVFRVNIIFIVTGITVNAKGNEKPLYKYYQSYMVEKCDTLLSIAYDMNVDSCTEKQIEDCVDEMISINSLDHKGTICYGNYIIVPYYSEEYR